MFLNYSIVAFRVFGKRGGYPKFSLLSSRHAFVSSSSSVWSAVVQDPLPDDWERAEVYTLLPEEIRLISAVCLSEPEPFERGSLSFELWAGKHIDVDDPQDFRSEAFDSFARKVVEEIAGEARADPWPPLQREGDYILQDTGNLPDAEAYLEAFDVGDQLLLAGHSRLLSGIRLRRAGDFLEEAFVQLTISLDAAMSFLRLHLEMTKGRQVAFREVYDYLLSVFPFGDSFVKFLQEVYDLRIMAVHPASRFGETWVSPAMVDTVYELEKWMTLIYRHIVMGEVPEGS